MNKKIFGILSLVFALSPITMFFIKSSSLDVATIAVIVYLFLAIAAIVCGFIGKKENKGLSIAGIVIGFISLIIMAFALIGFKIIKDSKDCVLISEDKYKCQVHGQEIEVPGIYLREDQIKK